MVNRTQSNTIPEPKFKPAREEKLSQFWQKLMKHWESRLLKLRIKLEECSDERESTLIRGQIRELKENLKLDRDDPIVD